MSARAAKRRSDDGALRAMLTAFGPFAVVLLFAVVLGFVLPDAAPTRRTWARGAILDAIRQVESSGREHPPDGDGGLAIGPYQIHRVYWLDATSAEPALGGTYEDCRRRDYAERIVAAYMRRYAPEAWARGDAEVIARIHNGGPRGHQRDATLRYWHRVRAHLP